MLLAAALAAAPARAAPPASERGGVAPRGEPRVVEEVVAVVRNPPGSPARIVTLTKLAEEARIALVSRGAVAAATQPLDAAALRASLEWLLDQMLLSDEAARLRLDEVARDEVEAALRAFRARFESRVAYDRFLEETELTEEELFATLARTVRVERYVQSRVGRGRRVADDEVDRWLAARSASAGAAATREAVRAHLQEERALAQVKELVRELRSRADIRILDPLRGGA
jgi:hypothetical protein